MSASTVTLNGLTTHDYGTYYPYFAIRNDSGGIVYVSTTDPECTPDTEGVVSIANGDGYMAANTDHDNTCLYLSGTGKVTVIAQHDKLFPFEKAQGGGDSGTASGSVVGLQIEKYIDEIGSACVSVSTLPYGFSSGSAVVYNNDIHILGGGNASIAQTNHYKFNGSSWESVSTLPYGFAYGSAVVYNNDIHILGNNSSNARANHYAIKNNVRHIAAMSPKGTHIMLSDNEDINYVSNATKVSNNIAEVTETGYVEVLAALPEPDNIKGYLTFY